MARFVGQGMATLVVRLFFVVLLTLADMRETDKYRFLDSPVSQVGLFSDAVESFAQHFSAAHKKTEAIKHILPRQSTAQPESTRRRGHPPVLSSTPAKLVKQ